MMATFVDRLRAQVNTEKAARQGRWEAEEAERQIAAAEDIAQATRALTKKLKAMGLWQDLEDSVGPGVAGVGAITFHVDHAELMPFWFEGYANPNTGWQFHIHSVGYDASLDADAYQFLIALEK